MNRKNEFVEIVKAHEGIIVKIAAFYSNSFDDRADLVQEIIYQLWKSFESFKGESKVSTWIYRVALNTSIYALRKSKREFGTDPLDDEILQVADSYNEESEARIRMLYEQIQQLNLLEKGLVLLYLEGKDYKEIAAITGITATNVGTKLARVREKLRTKIAKIS